MNKHTVAVLVNNQFGVLNRVTSMFRRRQFNINSLIVSETESPRFSRMTVVFEGEETTKNQLIDQLYKLPDVHYIKEMCPEESITCELLLIKMKNEAETRSDIRAAADAFDAKTADYTKDAVVLQLTGNSRKVDSFIELMRDYTILEICRTGIIALERGSETILQDEE
ncbi:MAG: acetolactate synthase small subunit [Clostridia bacterium]|nr:acetolactate synthase small subunit [Clostridia bacterium]